MKYLKTYESNKWGPIYSGTNDTLYINPQDIEDCLVDIIHLGFSINRTKIVRNNIFDDQSFIKTWEWLPSQKILNIYLEKKFEDHLSVQISNRGSFTRDFFEPGEFNYSIPDSHRTETPIIDEKTQKDIIEAIDDSTHKIMNSYLPKTVTNFGKYRVRQFSSLDGTSVVIEISFHR